MPLEEQQTTINFSRDEDTASVWTSDRTVMTKLDRLCEGSPEYYECTEVAKNRQGELLSKSYRIKDKSMLSFRAKKVKRELTEEQREAIRERAVKNLRRG